MTFDIIMPHVASDARQLGDAPEDRRLTPSKLLSALQEPCRWLRVPPMEPKPYL